jgi:hypothetical protein
MSWSSGRAPVRIALLLVVLAASSFGAAIIRKRRGEIWHTLDG